MTSGTGIGPGTDFTLEPREGYLYVHLVPGFEITASSMAALWIAISDAGRKEGMRHVLVEGDNVTRRLTTMQSFDHAGLAARLMPGLIVAACFRGYVPDQQTQFFQVAALNRGVRTEFFQDLNDALRWLGVGAKG
jgi:hypothetical protein